MLYSPYTGTKQSLKNGGTEVNPFITGVMSRSLRSTTDFKLNFCKMVARNKNDSMRARLSPAHERFPEKSKYKKKLVLEF